MYIGKVAKRCQVSAKTIRHYESLGLLPDVERRGAYRVYTEQHVRLIQLIRQVQGLGFRLAEVKAALDANDQARPWQTVCELIREKEETFAQEIRRLSHLKAQLAEHRRGIEDCLAENPDCDQRLF